MPPKKKVAAVITWYIHGSHADVLIGKILEGWKQDGGAGPDLELASMYLDQFPEGDMAREMSKKYNVPIFDTIERAVTVGSEGVPVDGVINVGEHGDYPQNERGQKLYPRKRFFAEVAAAFEKYHKVVPVFNDKHLAPTWEEAKWMVDRARELYIPFMSGSSMPVTFRDPPLALPMGCEIEDALVVGYSGLDIYGIHALEALQCMVERRRGAETGVASVQCLQGDAMWDALDDGRWSKELLEAGVQAIPKRNDDVDPRTLQGDDNAVILIEYRDGLRAAVAMLAGWVSGISFAGKLRGQSKPVATYFEERSDTWPHFAYLLKAIERMIFTGHPSYPVERCLLTTGIHDRVFISRAEGHKKLDTPELAIRYEPVDYPFAPNPEL